MIYNICLTSVIIELDVLLVINILFNFKQIYPNRISNLIKDCRELLHILGNSEIKHIYKEVNMVVNFIAKNVRNTCNDFHVLGNPPGPGHRPLFVV